MHHACYVLDQLGELDVGQSVIVQQKRVLAIEGAEGTNEMIIRAAPLIDKSQPDTVFVKLAKSGRISARICRSSALIRLSICSRRA